MTRRHDHTSRISTDRGRVRTATRRPRARSLALAVGAAATLAVTSAALGLGPTNAQADPGDTFVALGSSRLMQSEDLATSGLTLDTGSVVVGRDSDFSACLGEGNPWTAVIPGTGKPFSVAWTSSRHKEQALFETVGQATTAAGTDRAFARLLRYGLKGCRGSSSPWDFHYGKTESSGVGPGYAVWAPSYRGAATRPDGGVVVIRNGMRIGIVEVQGKAGAWDQALESVAKEAVSRLG